MYPGVPLPRGSYASTTKRPRNRPGAHAGDRRACAAAQERSARPTPLFRRAWHAVRPCAALRACQARAAAAFARIGGGAARSFGTMRDAPCAHEPHAAGSTAFGRCKALHVIAASRRGLRGPPRRKGGRVGCHSASSRQLSRRRLRRCGRRAERRGAATWQAPQQLLLLCRQATPQRRRIRRGKRDLRSGGVARNSAAAGHALPCGTERAPHWRRRRRRRWATAASAACAAARCSRIPAVSAPLSLTLFQVRPSS